MKILFPITNTVDAQALLYAEEVAISQGAKLVVLYITSPLTFSSCYAYPSLLYSVANLNMESIETAHQAIRHNIKSLLTGSNYEIMCLIGPQLDTIINVANDNGIDCIVATHEHKIYDKLKHKSQRAKLSSDISIMLYEGRKRA
ncbi:MAG: hypothetical protein ATN35_07455 [Epulopiscium sp. Nele67-Bin004]|nr:MAG: hypothetical protein ATN35_07455 [Epulopiscium sp. Nele67-Bin004]